MSEEGSGLDEATLNNATAEFHDKMADARKNGNFPKPPSLPEGDRPLTPDELKHVKEEIQRSRRSPLNRLFEHLPKWVKDF
jgi:hypothetical protein